MKKVLLMSMAMFTLVATSFAQTPAPAPKVVKMTPKPKAGGAETSKMEAGNKPKGERNMLDMSADQKAKFNTLHDAHGAAVKAIQENKALTPEARKAQIATLGTQYEADVKGVLNADQYAKWSQIRAKRQMEKAENKAERKADKMEQKSQKPAEGKAPKVPKGNVKQTTGAAPTTN